MTALAALVIFTGRCRWSTCTNCSTGATVLTASTVAIGRSIAARDPIVGAISASGSQM
jgi:hypothetical protein